jgi:hypothetical protein
MIGKVYAGDAAAGALAGASGTGAIITALGEVTTQILGVPLPVVLAAIAGACVARAYLDPVGFFKAFGRVLGWVVLGCALAPLAGVLAGKVLGAAVPTNAMAGLAALVATAEAWPLAVAFLRREFPGLASKLGIKGGDDAQR